MTDEPERRSYEDLVVGLAAAEAAIECLKQELASERAYRRAAEEELKHLRAKAGLPS